ncbi:MULTISPECIES: DNA (cytosine-5-)-methyltransferase [Thermotaleaceae]|uniref:Cytosine-specific methyltransferase n=1 Tax=Anaerosolibacter carboniphilus TaxID=1417629 RepID=A0A841KMP3_9FIRM|nr:MULTISPECIES: DNA (cytosine-5-)-methyltransferase [Thermotaleaceae]MBB6214706.1 DNA (cytosine-5)-methyltransferase 1 [Anaerosolibacter carboniphilus]MTI56209.1 DNA (cytosine-5-)-methyltransferase [Geosporobacter ferrireducens]
MNKLTLGSLFDGSGGFPLGGLISGITPVWASEIEPFPIRVTTKRLPFIKHYGDISCMDGSKIEPVDIITFGSPCQDLSIAGKRDGLDGRRSSLFYEAIRIVKEMRCATDGKKPRYIVWENVLGAFSSNKGEDFRCVLEGICHIEDETISIPKTDKWKQAGSIVGDHFSLAWRVLDAQYWGVPQRRKRIFLVADFAGGGAGEILFKSEGLSGYSKESIRSWQGTASYIADSTGEAGTICLNDQGGNRMDVTKDITCTLRAKSNHPPFVMDSAVFDNHGKDTRFSGPIDVAPTISATYGTGGNNQPFVVENPKTYDVRFTSEGTINARSNVYESDTARTIDTSGNAPDSNQGGIAVVESYALQGSMIGRDDKNGPRGDGVNEEVSFTLNTVDKHAVVYAIDRESFNCGQNYARNLGITEDGISSTLNAQGPSAVATPTYSSSKASFFTNAEKELANTLVATDYKDPPLINGNDGIEYTVRRLTPTECARLQGFPDWWCSDLGIENPTMDDLRTWYDIFETHRKVTGSYSKAKTLKQISKWLKNPHSDSAEYKMWGNGVALPNVCFVLSGIVWYTQLEGNT